jgi:transcriptional regulator with XRE-family HTH domain
MPSSKDLPQNIGDFIKDLRQNAQISLRQLADRAGVSNPYLSQIERGLRKPSAEVLQQIASALRVSTPAMYLRAGLLDAEGQQGVLAAIAVDPELTMAQKQSLTQIYETFRGENARRTDIDAEPDPADLPAEDQPPADLLAAVAAVEAGGAPPPVAKPAPAPEAAHPAADPSSAAQAPKEQS